MEVQKNNSLKTLKENLGIEEEDEISEERTEELSDKLEELTSSYDDELNDAISAIEAPSIEDVNTLKLNKENVKVCQVFLMKISLF